MKVQLQRSGENARNPLIHEKEIKEQNYPKTWLRFTDAKENFLSWGYLGQQNKGAGWLILTAQQQPDALFFENLLAASLHKRKSLFKNLNTTNAFRLFNGVGDGLGGVTVDYYDGYLVFSWYNETIAALKEEVLQGFLTAYTAFCGTPALGVVEKFRYSTSKIESQVLQGAVPESLLIVENDVHYRVYLDEGLMTGIFLDQRHVRNLLKEKLAQDKTVLNTFSYTGAFSVASKVGGAKATTSVDLAKRSLKKTQEQFAANDLPLTDEKIYVMDIFDFFKYAQKKKLTYDIVVLDPPSFARNKKKTFSVAKNYGELVTASQTLIQKGILVCSTNAANVNLKQFKKMIEDSLVQTKRKFHFGETFRLPEDFSTVKELPEENYLKVCLVYLEEQR